MPETRIDYILNAAQAQTEATKLQASFAGVGKAAQSAGVAGAAGMTQAEVATKGAAVSGAQLEAVYAGVVKAQGANSAAALELAAAIGVSTTATTANTVATEANVVAQNASGEGFSRLTTRINVGRGALAGYDAAIEGVVRAFGGIQLGFAVAIGLAAALLPKIISLIRAKEEQIKIDKEQITTDLLIEKGSERTTRVAADMTAAFRILRAEKEVYIKTTKDLTDRLHVLETQGSATSIMVGQGGETYVRVVKNAEDLQHEVAKLNAEIGKQEEVLGPALETIRRHQEATHETTEETIRWAVATHKIAAEDIPFMTEQLNRAVPVLDEFSKKLNDLAVPKFDAATSLPGINSLQAAVEATFQLARDQGITDWAQQVKFATPALKALDDALKHYGGTVEGYNKLLAQNENGMRAAIALMKEQTKAFDENFNKRKAQDVGPQLEMEALKAEARLREDDLGLRMSIIHREFDLRREKLKEDGQATKENFQNLELMELIATKELLVELKKRADATVEHYAQLSAERAKDLTRQREFRIKELAEWGEHYVKQRQSREEQEKKFFENQAKIEFTARSDREGRKETQADALRAQSDELKRVREAFGQTSIAARTFDEMLKNIAEDGQAGFKGISASISGLASELFSVANIANAVGNAIGSAFEAAISGTESFGHSLTKAVLTFIATIAQQFGAMFILIGSGLIWLGWPGGGALIGYGIALEALAGVLRGLANNIGKSNAAPSAAGAATASGGGGGAPTRQPTPPLVVSFPTSGSQSQPIVIQLDRSASRDLIEGHEVVTEPKLRRATGKTPLGRSIRKLATV